MGNDDGEKIDWLDFAKIKKQHGTSVRGRVWITGPLKYHAETRSARFSDHTGSSDPHVKL
eukprot:3933718-Rhodomonas_salina.2